MPSPAKVRRPDLRELEFLASPRRWPLWPFLPLIRPLPDGQEPECGILYDARGATGKFGYSATVFLSNVCALPDREADLLASPRSTYDTLDELVSDGWTVD